MLRRQHNPANLGESSGPWSHEDLPDSVVESWHWLVVDPQEALRGPLLGDLVLKVPHPVPVREFLVGSATLWEDTALEAAHVEQEIGIVLAVYGYKAALPLYRCHWTWKSVLDIPEHCSTPDNKFILHVYINSEDVLCVSIQFLKVMNSYKPGYVLTLLEYKTSTCIYKRSYPEVLHLNHTARGAISWKDCIKNGPTYMYSCRGYTCTCTNSCKRTLSINVMGAATTKIPYLSNTGPTGILPPPQEKCMSNRLLDAHGNQIL